jgi:uncharacterized protein (TIGR02757 family)
MLDKVFLKDFLDEKVAKYNCKNFIELDPISIPHQCVKKEDIEIIGFLVATFAWGNRNMILKNGNKLLQIMQYEPHQFILNFDSRKSSTSKINFNHRTFFTDDLIYFFDSLKNIYNNYGGLERCFFTDNASDKVFHGINKFRNIFFELKHLSRTEKHVSNPLQNSACKRINMYLRWMVRKDNCGVDFGLWNCIKSSDLLCPLDIHSGRIARQLQLLKRKQDDWKATIELTNVLRELDVDDPIKYDFALFSLGVNDELN